MQWIGLNIIMRRNETCRAPTVHPSFLLKPPLLTAPPRVSSLEEAAPEPGGNRSLESLAPSQPSRHQLHREECIFHIPAILSLPLVVLIGLEREITKGKLRAATRWIPKELCKREGGWTGMDGSRIRSWLRRFFDGSSYETMYSSKKKVSLFNNLEYTIWIIMIYFVILYFFVFFFLLCNLKLDRGI